MHVKRGILRQRQHDDAYNQVGYEILTSHLKPGCAENAIVNGFLDMMEAQ